MIKTNIKMRVTPEQSAKVQEICFKNGINWRFSGDIILYEDKPYIFIDKKKYLGWLREDQSDSFMKVEEEIDPELFIRTSGTCIEEKQEFTYPVWFKNKEEGYVVRFDSLTDGEVVYGFENWILDSNKSDNWTEHTDSEIWEQVENPDLVTDTDNNKAKNPNSKHYELWENFEAIDVIKLVLTDEEYKGFLKGNILKYQLRLGKKDEVSKEIEKIEDYKRELKNEN